MFLEHLNAHLIGNEDSWTFIGVPGWQQTQDNIIYPPVWSYPNFDPDPTRIPNSYAHELAREDFAFLTSQPLDDTDISVDYKCPYGSIIHGGIVFRSMDSARFYVVDVVELGRKAQAYELTLWIQDQSGYRRELARGLVPHSVVPDRILQNGPRTRAEWDHSSPDWVRIRVQATGTFIRVSMDGQIVFDLRDATYPAGCVGLVARGAVSFRNLQVDGTPTALPKQWTVHEGELPRFFYPGGQQPEGFNAYPVVCRTGDGVTLVAWSHDPQEVGPPRTIVLTRSADEGQTWSPPQIIFSRPAHCSFSHIIPTSLFAHEDESLSCLARFTESQGTLPVTLVLRSTDGGETWLEGEEFAVADHSLSSMQYVHLYSPMKRLSDGTVVMCGYEADDSWGHDNARRRDRSLLFRSRDDGITWEEPTYFDSDNFDHNECMVAEIEPGRLIAFMRTLRATYMWTSTSEDGGRSWAPLIQSDVSAECPFLLDHSSGVLIMGSRGHGTFLKMSYDGGQTWSEAYRMSPTSAMMGMVEMADRRVLNVMHEGYRVPGNVRGQFFHVTPEGPVAAW